MSISIKQIIGNKKAFWVIIGGAVVILVGAAFFMHPSLNNSPIPHAELENASYVLPGSLHITLHNGSTNVLVDSDVNDISLDKFADGFINGKRVAAVTLTNCITYAYGATHCYNFLTIASKSKDALSTIPLVQIGERDIGVDSLAIQNNAVLVKALSYKAGPENPTSYLFRYTLKNSQIIKEGE